MFTMNSKTFKIFMRAAQAIKDEQISEDQHNIILIATMLYTAEDPKKVLETVNYLPNLHSQILAVINNPSGPKWQFIPRDCHRLEELNTQNIVDLFQKMNKPLLTMETPLPITEEQVRIVATPCRHTRYLKHGTASFLDYFYDYLFHLHCESHNKYILKCFEVERSKIALWLVELNIELRKLGDDRHKYTWIRTIEEIAQLSGIDLIELNNE